MNNHTRQLSPPLRLARNTTASRLHERYASAPYGSPAGLLNTQTHTGQAQTQTWRTRIDAACFVRRYCNHYNFHVMMRVTQART